MRNYFILMLLLAYSVAGAQEPALDKVFFENSPMEDSYFYTHALYKPPSFIKNKRYKLPVDKEHFFTPGNALLLQYTSARGGNWQASVLFHPQRGIDKFSAATTLQIWMMVASPQTTTNQLPAIGLGNRRGQNVTTVPLGNFVTNLHHGKWMQVTIPLDRLGSTQEVAGLDSLVFVQNDSSGLEHILYLDQVELTSGLPSLPAPAAKITSIKPFEKHVDLVWDKVNEATVRYVKIYRSTDNKTFYPVGIQSPYLSRYADYTDTVGKPFFYKISFLNHQYQESALSPSVSATTRPLTDEQMLDMVQEAHFRYYWDGAEPNCGLALENIPGRRHMIATGASGFGIMALIAGVERKFITRQQAVDRFDRITSFLANAEKFHGAFPHFYNGQTGKVEPFFGQRDNGGDLVETSFLMQGLLAARQYFNGTDAKETAIRNRINALWQGIEWDWYRRYPNNNYLYWHWSPDKEWIINHQLIGWNETMITYFLAISSPTHAVPASLYYSGWASQDTVAQKYRSNWGRTGDGSNYTNGKTYFGIPLPVGVNNGGPLFFIHYSFMGLDPHQMTDAYTNYFVNNRNIALINYRYCIENPEDHRGYGADAWGLTASDGLWRYSADEPVPHADHGKLTPTGALASMPYTPAQSMEALKNYYRNYGKFLWGAYGFKDAFNLDENWCAEKFMGLNQAPITVMIENYRSGLLWKLFMSCPEVQMGLQAIKAVAPVSR